jgi:hypothetical protein
VPSRYLPLAIVLTAALGTTTRAQTKPDFSGDWTYDRSKSTVVRVDNTNVDAPPFGTEFSARHGSRPRLRHAQERSVRNWLRCVKP